MRISKFRKILLLCGLLVWVNGRQTFNKGDALHPTGLRCENLKNPLGIDAQNPALSWISESGERGQVQTAYRILAASSEENLKEDVGDLWDSQKVDSDQSTYVRYVGKELTLGMQCFWKVKVWDKNGVESAWSKPAKWSMGLLHETDWQAKWIGLDKAVGEDDPGNEHRRLSARYVRKDFTVPKQV